MSTKPISTSELITGIPSWSSSKILCIYFAETLKAKGKVTPIQPSLNTDSKKTKSSSSDLYHYPLSAVFLWEKNTFFSSPRLNVTLSTNAELLKQVDSCRKSLSIKSTRMMTLLYLRMVIVPESKAATLSMKSRQFLESIIWRAIQRNPFSMLLARKTMLKFTTILKKENYVSKSTSDK